MKQVKASFKSFKAVFNKNVKFVLRLMFWVKERVKVEDFPENNYKGTKYFMKRFLKSQVSS